MCYRDQVGVVRGAALGAVALCLFVGCGVAQERSTANITTCIGDKCTTLSEPAPVKIEDLWKQADVVAVVQILSGDTEHYLGAVYKTKISQAFKGTSVGQTIYIGRLTGYALGNEYLAFLRRTDEAISPDNPQSPLNYGRLQTIYQIMYEGFSFMDIGYACVFDGRTTREQCDYGVQLSPKYVILPKKVKTFPAGTEDGGGPRFWVRRDAFLRFVAGLGKP